MNVARYAFRRWHLAVVVSVVAMASVGDASARTFAMPHVFDQKGRISNTQNTFDTTIFAQYTGSVACIGGGQPDTPIELYLYEDSGVPMRGLDGTEVCNPCNYTMGATQRKLSINVESLFAGSGGINNVKLGFGVIVVGGADPDGVTLQGSIVNAHTGPSDLSVFGFEPQPITVATKAASWPCGRIFTSGQLLVTPGAASGTPYTFDTTMFMTYAGGLAGVPAGSGATVDVYLYDDQTGELVADAVGTPVCNPCTINLDAGTPKSSFRLGGALPGGAIISAAVSAVCVVSGDAGNVAIQPFVVNTHSGPFDVSMYGPPLQEVTSSTASNVPDDLAKRLGLRNYPNPFNPRTTFAYSLPRADHIQVRVFDAQGALVRTLLSDSQDAGDHEVAWDGVSDDGQRMPSGVYFGRIDGAGVSDVQKVMLLK